MSIFLGIWSLKSRQPHISDTAMMRTDLLLFFLFKTCLVMLNAMLLQNFV